MSSFKEIALNFKVYLYSEKGLSQASVLAYTKDVEEFFSYLEKKGEDLISLKEEELVSYFLHLKNATYASSSIARFTFALKALFRFLIREHKLSQTLLLFLESPKVWQLIPEVLSYEEIERILQLFDTTTIEGARDRAIVEVLYGSGLRVSELCSLNIQDVFETHVKVFGKRGKERIVPIGKQGLTAIDNYLAQRNDDNKALFLNKRGSRIDRIFVWKMVKEKSKEARITKNISPHTFRHSFATHLLDNGADLRIIQEMMGHATIFSTERYTHVSQKQLKIAFSKFHPKN